MLTHMWNVYTVDPHSVNTHCDVYTVDSHYVSTQL